MPLKVFVNQRDDDRITFSDSNDAQVTENTPGAIIQRSMDLWTQATQGRVTFQFCNSAEEADIVCNFTDEPNGLEAASALGLTSHRTSGGRHIADIRLLTVSPSSTDTLPRSEFAAATLHEFGHALGLEHSNKVSDVMYRAVHAKPLVNLSDNDRDRVCKLYTYNH
jgi:predicted Zn-dependent protease